MRILQALFGLLALLPVLVLPASPSAPGPGQREGGPPPDFDQLLAEAGMTFVAPRGFERVEIQANPLFLYDRALRSPDGDLEVRYAVRPLSRILVDYEDPHSSAPDPNHMFPLMFQSMVSRLSNGSHSPTREYPSDQARERFNAHWAAAAVFDVFEAFRASHGQALVVAIHGNQRADAYSIFLFDDYEAVRDRINEYLGSLAFSP